ncbi:MAG: hypothetical protein QG635_1156 [Bacteroidota bacterium]|nr:hypothetical protein [Bacteroidota bacterium]
MNFEWDENQIRIISVRQANKKERKIYNAKINKNRLAKIEPSG